MKSRFRIFYCISSVVLFSVISSGCSYQPLFESGDLNPGAVISENGKYIEIRPVSGTFSSTGLLFYPGGLVDSHVYDEILADFSVSADTLTVVVKMPFNLAVFAADAGLSVIEDFPEIKEWIIAGHSLGGAMAASTVADHPSVYKGLIFMDSYPPDGNSLKDWPGAVLSLYSSVEKVSDAERMQKTLDLIPPATWLTDENRSYPAVRINYSVIHQINGGSHSYFGTYGPQAGDYTPTVSREAFHAEVVYYMREFSLKTAGYISQTG